MAYINNKDLLAEIHKCKMSYCSYLDDYHKDFDVIVQSMEELTPEIISETVSKKGQDIPAVFRVMTYDHIPLETDKKKRSRVGNTDHAVTNFSPFKHFIMEDGELKEVLRSHWTGGFENGHFSTNHGKISNRMGVMFMKLVDNYARIGKFRSYCVDTQTEAMTHRGWLRYDEINENDQIMSYDCNDDSLKWSKIKSIYRGNYQGNMFKLDVCGLDALVSPNHKFITREGAKTVEMLKETDNVVLMGLPEKGAETSKYSDAFVELVGWAVTEGCFCKTNKSATNFTVTISQNEGLYADRIRDCLTTLGIKWKEHNKVNPNAINVNFRISVKDTPIFFDAISGLDRKKKILKYDFLLSLTKTQRELLFNTMIDGDGWRSRTKNITTDNTSLHVGYAQRCAEHVDSFIFLCTLLGFRTSVTAKEITHKSQLVTPIHIINIFNNDLEKKSLRHCRVENINMHGAKRKGVRLGQGKETHPNEPTVPYNGTIWCPETEYGTFLARRGKFVYVTHNSYLDEMKGNALQHLVSIALKFDESKSENPFGFYSISIKHCMVRVLNIEKRVQEIRDDLLISYGAAPSITRQIDHEMSLRAEYKKPDDSKLIAKRGRKTAVARAAIEETIKEEAELTKS